ncbi:MAG: hypothetical protein ACYTGZ_12745 [Planctomycetota bacterium]|jgi:hypothetical protein
MRVVLVLLLVALPAGADQLVAYGKRTWWSPGRSFRLDTAEVKGGGITFAIVAKDGRVRGKGKLDHMPVDAVVFEDGTGFVFWGRYTREGHGIAVARYDHDGTRRWAHRFKDLFDAEQKKGFPRSLSFVFWSRSMWNFPTRGYLVGTTTTRVVKLFNTRTGAITPAAMDAVLDSLKLKPPPAAAIDTAGEWYLDRARNDLLAIAGNKENSVLVRVAAAAAAQRKVDYAPLWRSALDDPEAALRAVRAAATVLTPEEAKDFLESAATRKDTAMEAVNQLAKLGATRELVRVVSHGDTPPDARRVAGAVLRNLPKEDVVPGLLKEFNDADADTALVLLDTLIAVEGKTLARKMQPHQQKLLKLIDRKGANVIWLAQSFARYPTTEAVQPLLRAARKQRGKRKESKAIFEALRKCTGMPIGDNLGDWEKALRNR